MALDKTGTITSGEPRVTDIIPADGYDERSLLKLANALERKSEHPLAKAILIRSDEEKIETGEVSDFRTVAGNGLTGKIGDSKLAGGNYHFISSQAEVSDSLKINRKSFQKREKRRCFLRKTAKQQEL